MDEFSCPGHDFAITMFGGESEVCGICEISRSEETMMAESATPWLIAEICPASHTVVPIFEKIPASAFADAGRRADRRRSFNRISNGFSAGDHDVRSCRCVFFVRDWTAFRKALRPYLSDREPEVLDICDLLRPRTDTALGHAFEAMMGKWATSNGLKNGQASALRRYVRDCANTRSEFKGASRTLESELAYLMHAVDEFDKLEDIVVDRTFEQLVSGRRLFRIKKKGRRTVWHSVLSVAEDAADVIARAWFGASHGIVRP